MTDNEPQHPEVDDLGLTSEDWEDLQNRLQLYGTVSNPLPGRSKKKRSAGWTSTPAVKSSASPPRGGRRGLAGIQARLRTAGRDWNQRPGNDHHRGRPRPQ